MLPGAYPGLVQTGHHKVPETSIMAAESSLPPENLQIFQSIGIWLSAAGLGLCRTLGHLGPSLLAAPGLWPTVSRAGQVGPELSSFVSDKKQGPSQHPGS